IHTIPDWIGDLKKLQALNLSEMNLHSIPQKLLQLNLPFSFENSPFTNGIQLYDTKLATQPISLFMQPREMIEAYYESEQVAINEAKVIFLGDGGVGKTHTIKRIKNDGKKDDYETKTTSGVDIINYWAKNDTKQFNINFWDFGGQEIMHAMHRCFLTERTCYVVVLSNREDSNLTARARYWLKNIQSFAPGARVLLAVNKWDDIQSGGLDMNRLIQDYDNLCDTPIYYSAKNSNDDDFNLLTKAIIREASKLDSTEMRFPVQWANIRRELQIEAQNHHYIDKQKYHNICKTYGLESPDIRTWLLEWFNDLGICFSYHQGKEKNGNPVELDSYKVLNPKWLTNAIYIIINHGNEVADHGKLHINIISQLLRTPELGVLKNVTYKNHEISYVLDVMRKFTLSYKISSSHEFIPALCEENTPEQLHPEGYPYHISYQMKYTYLPDSVVHQLMIRSYKNLNPEKIWRKGLRIDIDYVGLSAVVYMLDDDSTLRIDVYSHGSVEPWILLNNIRHDLISINSNLGLKAKDEIIIRDHDFDIVKSVNELLSAREQGIDKYPLYNEKTNRTIFRSVDEILGITFGEENMKAIEKQAAEKNQSLAQTFAHCTIKEVNIYPQSPKQATPDAMEIINVLVQQQGDILDKAISCLIQEFEKSEDKETEKLLTEVKKDSGKGALQKIDEFLKRTASIGDNMKKTYKAGKGVADVIKSAWPVIIAKCPEILEHLSIL
ncbi:MAG: COR domain-containing protein, partial [Acutalibacteraceae bacterium]|nr:COR domain-containing protein [Acutalibacteraceae bacterium]